MEFDELLITTGVDALVRTVKEKQKVELADLAAKLNIDAQTLEEWARVLEEEGIIKIEYNLARTYLVWVKPTQEEIAIEKESFYEEKANVVQEVSEMKGRLSKDATELADLKESFDGLYEQIYPKIEKLEKTVSPLPAGTALTSDLFAKHQQAITNLSGQIDSIKEGIEEVRKEIEDNELVKGVREEKESPIEKLEKTRTELIVMKEGLAELRKRSEQQVPRGMQIPEVAEIKKKFEGLKRDFVDLRAKNGQLKQDMMSLQESSEVLKSVAEAVMGREEKITGLRADVEELADQTEKIAAKIKQASSDVKKQVDMIERVDETVKVAKSLLAKFPSQEKVEVEAEKLEAAEKSLVEKMGAIEKLMEASGNTGAVNKKFEDLSEKIDDKIAEAKAEMDELAAQLAEEKSTYMTFQKIKEKIVGSIDLYQKQADMIEKEIEKIRKDAISQKESLKQDSVKIQETLKKEGTAEIIKTAEAVREKKRLLDEVKESIGELSRISDNLNKRITLLSRESQLLEIRMSGAGGGAGGSGSGRVAPPSAAESAKTEAKEREIHREMELNAQEELEFKKKREELKALIKKLWEE